MIVQSDTRSSLFAVCVSAAAPPRVLRTAAAPAALPCLPLLACRLACVRPCVRACGSRPPSLSLARSACLRACVCRVSLFYFHKHQHQTPNSYAGDSNPPLYFFVEGIPRSAQIRHHGGFEVTKRNYLLERVGIPKRLCTPSNKQRVN